MSTEGPMLDLILQTFCSMSHNITQNVEVISQPPERSCYCFDPNIEGKMDVRIQVKMHKQQSQPSGEKKKKDCIVIMRRLYLFPLIRYRNPPVFDTEGRRWPSLSGHAEQDGQYPFFTLHSCHTRSVLEGGVYMDSWSILGIPQPKQA